ncbi:hypothetical protein DFA_11810 [Cavenderia fasciculata]|uniref:Uncharacterized protein n=1 Tax=Cavenderia fasciculata TaxID=261658 RepID=F4QEA0_CACFS|nr:uncharacterized protein DFA_11810 [Cavenderia fasciculata]EGG14047.1 hypothetical protein DFA_11810 [Cavenderia fasciculata]|eukprot:XP_004350755.1 hypothetical protein DFA_11810 [Cavenderia fasciculata]
MITAVCFKTGGQTPRESNNNAYDHGGGTQNDKEKGRSLPYTSNLTGAAALAVTGMVMDGELNRIVQSRATPTQQQPKKQPSSCDVEIFVTSFSPNPTTSGGTTSTTTTKATSIYSNDSRIQSQISQPNKNDDNDTIAQKKREESDFGLLLWESSQVVSWFIVDQCKRSDDGSCIDKPIFINNETTTIELGAGIGLPSLVSMALGSKLSIITDYKQELLDNVQRIIDYNKQITTSSFSNYNGPDPLYCVLAYSQFTDQVLQLPKDIDYLFASDLFYNNTKDYDDIFATFKFFLNRNRNLIIYCSYQIRSSEKTIGQYLLKWGMNATVIPLDQFLPNTVQLKSEIILLQIVNSN